MAPAQPLISDGPPVLPAQPNQSLMDGMSVLQTVSELRRPVGSRELGRLLGLEPTRVNRLLKTLAHMGMVVQDEARKYLPGPGIHVLAAQSLRGSGLLRCAVPYLEDLRTTGHMVSLGVLWRTQVCYLYFAVPGERGEGGAEALGREAAYPAEESGLGLALLAHESDQAIEHRYRDQAIPDNTVNLTGRGGLLSQVRRTRRQRYALTPGYGRPLTRTLAVSIGTPAVAAIGLAGSFTDDAVPELRRRLQQAADSIDASLP